MAETMSVSEFIDSILSRLCDGIAPHYHNPDSNVRVKWNEEIRIFTIHVRGTSVSDEVLEVFAQEYLKTHTRLKDIVFDVVDAEDTLIFGVEFEGKMGDI